MHDDEHLSDLFRAERGRLFAIAYRMSGSVTEAEDLVQEAFVRYGRLDRSTVREPGALLTTMVTRLAIDLMRSAKTQREHYTGSWLPEPLVSEGPGVADQAETADSISMAFLVLLEILSPVERAVFLLREAFEYDYDGARHRGRAGAGCPLGGEPGQAATPRPDRGHRRPDRARGRAEPGCRLSTRTASGCSRVCTRRRTRTTAAGRPMSCGSC
jgi:DNA-directed RNA polymerase specialized sigma24 family protein